MNYEEILSEFVYGTSQQRGAWLHRGPTGNEPPYPLPIREPRPYPAPIVVPSSGGPPTAGVVDAEEDCGGGEPPTTGVVDAEGDCGGGEPPTAAVVDSLGSESARESAREGG
ncbi:hypothetical protein PFICI_14078 [Pestalotiopsis fici W106-1]|uniref:Uncharacterized protein n=1 Tax=Pestalotiopsis fici (strain W106-1 / CGMCC3.15140) TaxID=1229662 RepID=W3WM20_PESFW|nr:uncharacterized protein PFICI_14078 [Pestalotiopsis fici W106-1]ETS74212.1 hypothetical protein PFICI_14078 [Pestalotiopsis fici W106-1]